MLTFNLPFLLLTALFAILRLTGVIKWSWWLVFIPTYILAAIWIAGILFLFAVERSINN